MYGASVTRCIVVLAFWLTPFAASAVVQPEFDAYRLYNQPGGSSRAFGVAAGDTGVIVVGGDASEDSVMSAAFWSVELEGSIFTFIDMEFVGVPDPSRASAALAVESAPKTISGECGRETAYLLGYWNGGSGGGSLPIAWHDTTANDTADFYYELLPTLGGTGTGQVIRANGIIDMPIAHWTLASGWSAPPEGTAHAVAWIAESILDPCACEIMGGYGAGLPSRANDITAREDSTMLAVGWAMTPGGMRIPQRWWRSQQGVWTRAAMPMPQGAVQGSVSSLVDFGRFAIAPRAVACGATEDTSGTKHATYWSRADDMSPWIPEDLGVLDGYDESAAIAIARHPDLPEDVYVVGKSYSGETSVATLWVVGEFDRGIYNLNHIITNDDSLEVVLGVATDVCWIPGDPDVHYGISSWGYEAGGAKASSSKSGGPHGYLLTGGPMATSSRLVQPAHVAFDFSASPNPFSDGMHASFALGEMMAVELVVFDLQGRLVARLKDGVLAAGEYTASWDGKDVRGRRLASGIYFLRLEADNQVLTRKVVLLR